jgi:hypothetical protein
MNRIEIAVVVFILCLSLLPAAFAQTIPWTDPDTGLVYDIPAQGDYCLDFDGDSVCDIDFTDGKVVVYSEGVEETTTEEDDGDGGSNEDPKTYCDVPNPSNPCHDRKDYSETTGLYTCMDGSHEADWRDCNGDEDEIEVDDVEDFEGGDSEGTATGDRESDPEGDSICGNDETGEEWTC